MKKLILCSLIIGLITSANAQIRFGIKAGGNFSNLYTSDNNEGFNSNQYKGKFGYHFGSVLEYSLSNRLSIQPELLYLNHGAKLKNKNSFLMKDGHFTLNTLLLPVNLKASFEIGYPKLFVYAGPYIGYNMYGKIKGKIDGVSVEQELFSKDSNMKRWDFGAGIGVGIEMNKFTLSLGNQYSMQNISKSERGKMKTGNLTLSAGYFF